MQETYDNKTTEQLVTEFATADSLIKSQTDKRDAILNELVARINANPEQYPDRIVSSISGDIRFQIGKTEQLAINKAYVPSQTIVDNLVQLVRINPSSYLTVALAKAYGLNPTSENIGDDKPYMLKTVKPRATRQ